MQPVPSSSCFLLTFLLSFSTLCRAAECIPFTEALNHIGEIHCVTGKVLNVKQGSGGVHYLDFCEDYRLCPFTVVIFPRDLKSIGDVRQLQGRTIEVHGPVKGYDGRAQIVLAEARQLSGDSARIPPLPKSYDVEKAGHYSAGNISRPKTRKTYAKKVPATLPIEVGDDPPE
ncbi:MAG: hypothetical protein WB421_09270 [Terriglobales bacterium]|jgi:hypothetical protein